MNFVTSALKVVVGLAVFASLMILEFASYTRAVAEEVRPQIVIESQKLAQTPLALPVKKESRSSR